MMSDNALALHFQWYFYWAIRVATYLAYCRHVWDLGLLRAGNNLSRSQSVKKFTNALHHGCITDLNIYMYSLDKLRMFIKSQI